ncbi:hypothetical protein BJ742DRAFT_790221 [Cladochytrium replicatum]|nr:hypothetical protein BJ742DRAFT_790221 [Cladochytrium replicatum]
MPFDLAAKIFRSLQHRLFFVVMVFGRFNLYVLSFWHLFTLGSVEHRKLEVAGQAVFWSCSSRSRRTSRPGNCCWRTSWLRTAQRLSSMCSSRSRTLECQTRRRARTKSFRRWLSELRWTSSVRDSCIGRSQVV